jgi:outer membrane receptor for ferrienterochelin and colicins
LNSFWKEWSADFYYHGYHRTHADLDRDGFTDLTRRASNAGGGTLFKRLLNGSARLTLGASTLDDFRRGGDRLDVVPDQTNITEQIHSDRTAAFLRWNHTVTPDFYYNLSSSFSRMTRASYYGAGFDPNAYGSTRNPLSTTDASAGYQRGRHTLSIGGQYWYERIEDVYLGYGRNTRQTFRNTGFYAQDEWRASPRLVLLGGVRADKSNLLDHWVFSPRGNVRYGITRSLNLRVGVSTGFRPPQVFDEDLHIAAVNGEAMYVRLATGLKEESSRSLTSALDYSGRLGNGPFQLGASFFWTRLDDVFQLREVSSTDHNRVMERTNGPGSRFRGVEFSTSWTPHRRLSLRGGATFQQARYDVPESIFSSLRYLRTPNRYGYAGADLDLPWGIECLNTFDFTGSMLVPHYAGYIPADRLETSPVFGVWNLVVSRTWPVRIRDHSTLRAFLRMNNLGDSFQPDLDRGPERDSTYMYGPMVPRSAMLGMTLTF